MTAPAFPPRRILVVDDEPLVCEAVKMMLNFDGHAVEVTHGAREALAALEARAFDIVITDFSMPGMKGDELAARIKARNPDQPVLMITAHAEMLPDQIPGVDCLVSKPFLLENLRTAISKVTKAKTSGPGQ